MYQQRQKVPTGQREMLDRQWAPQVSPPQPLAPEDGWIAVASQPEEGDTYVVVDEIIGDEVTLVVAPWPRLDAGGRLAFELPPPTSPSTTHWIDTVIALSRRSPRSRRPLPEEVAVRASRTAFTEAVNRSRARYRQVERELRIGDAFRVRGIQSGRPSEWEDILDVTTDAREAAKAALFGAVAPKLDRTEVLSDPQQVTRQAEEPPPAGTPLAGPAV
jgi:hypothetical protein